MRFDVQRRFFNIVAMEMIGMQFGLKEPPSLTELWKENYNVSLSSLIRNGRTMTLDQYFDIRSNYKSSKDLD